MGKRDEYRSGKGGASYKSWEGWNQRGYWGGRGEPKELVVRVETDQSSAKKGRKKDKKKRARSSSSSSSSSTSSSCRRHKGSRKSSKKKERKDKKDCRKDSAPALSSADLEELRAFRRQAEFDKVKQEVLNGMESAAHGKGRALSRPEEAAMSTLSMTPKSKKCMLAQTRVLGDNGSVVALDSGDVEGWDQVREQLESHPPPLVKKLLGQLQGGDAPIPRLKADAVKQIIALLQGD